MCSIWGSSINWAAQPGTWAFIVQSTWGGVSQSWYEVSVAECYQFAVLRKEETVVHCCCIHWQQLELEEDVVTPLWASAHKRLCHSSGSEALGSLSSYQIINFCARSRLTQGCLPTLSPTRQYLDQSSRCHYLPINDRRGDLAWDDLNVKCFP